MTKQNEIQRKEQKTVLLSRVNEIVKIAREYMAKYNLNEREAIECAIEDIEKELKEMGDK
ncbi:MAG: hypothetical protein ACLTHJ_04495 [Intestinibacter bartlettii]|jgi:hypothetical protein